MTRLYLVRHGETEWNANHRVQGTMNTELNENGIRQAELLAERLVKENIDAVYTSSLNRAKSTAERISDRLSIEMKELHDCREICLGPWQGLTIDEIKESYGDHFQIYRENPVEFNMPGAETYIQVAERFCNAVNGVIEDNKGKNIVLVSHGSAIKAAIISMLGIDLNHYNKFRIDNASISILIFDEKYHGGVVLQSLNDTCHL